LDLIDANAGIKLSPEARAILKQHVFPGYDPYAGGYDPTTPDDRDGVMIMLIHPTVAKMAPSFMAASGAPAIVLPDNRVRRLKA